MTEGTFVLMLLAWFIGLGMGRTHAEREHAKQVSDPVACSECFKDIESTDLPVCATCSDLDEDRVVCSECFKEIDSEDLPVCATCRDLN
jgi:hypothetical protein